MSEVIFFVKGRWVYLDPHPNSSITKKLVNNLSYARKSSRFMPNPEWGIVRLYDSKRHRFPVGLLRRVKDLLDVNHSNEIMIDSRPIYDGLREYQQDALTVMLSNRCGIIKIPTGGGKTRVALNYIKSVNKPTLVLVPTLDLVKQWREQVPEYVHVKTYASIKKKDYIQQFSVVIFDECHHVAAKTLFKIGMNLSEDALVFGFSGTPLSRDDDNLKVEAVLGPIIYDISTQKLKELGFICGAKIFFHRLSPYWGKGYITYPDLYEEYIVNNTERNNIIVNIANNCMKPCLILINRISHGEYLFDELVKRNVNVVFLNGQLKERDAGGVDVVIATSIFDEGVDLPEIKTLILGGGGKSDIKVIQRIGRGLRLKSDGSDLVVHDFVDDAKWFDKHSINRRKIFVDEGHEVVVVDD